jgi:predicted ATPase/class 3 adenylate cyclase
MVTSLHGNVSFLFTDIEGSTRLLEQDREAYGPALARHHELLASTVKANAGRVFETVGDAVYAAFPTASDALSAALESQRALAREEWGGLGEIRVRMAVHTGEVEFWGNKYFGPALYRCARLMATGHGGQVLISAATKELITQSVPDDVVLRDMGTHRLKDLSQPERIFQLVAPDLRDDFPGLKTLDSRPNNLPAQPNALVGRVKELAGARELLTRPDVRLVTLTGPGGVGKTRLALQVAADILNDFLDGVFFVALAPISNPELVGVSIARTLGVPDVGGMNAGDQLVNYLRDRHMLLVLDNFEQVISAGTQVADLLATCARLKVVVTSRSVLHVYGENEFGVPPLQLPEAGTPTERIATHDAVRLFVERSQAVRADFSVTDENAAAVAEICHRLDGLPLALELAAARSKLFAPEALLTRLDERLALLTSGFSNLPARLQTLRNAIAWSYDLLDPGEQTMFRRLGIFAGGCDAAAAGSVCDPDNTVYALDVLGSLVDKSLLRRDVGLDGEPRFGMLETIREFALEELAAAEEHATIESRHAAYFFELGRLAAPHLVFGSERPAWLGRLFPEADNVRAAFQRAVGSDDAEPALQALTDLWVWFWALSFREGRRWGEQLLALPSALPSPARAGALTATAMFCWAMQDWEGCKGYATEAVELSTKLGDGRLLAWAKLVDGWWRTPLLGDATPTAYDESRTLFRELDDGAGIGWVYVCAGCSAAEAGNLPLTLELCEKALQITRPAGDGWLTAVATFWMALMETHGGMIEESRGHWAECLPVFEAIHDLKFLGIGHTCLALDARREDDAAEAARRYRAALSLARDSGDPSDVPVHLDGLAYVALANGEPERAARLLGAAETARAKGEAIFFPMYEELFADTLRQVERSLGADAAAQRAEGRHMSEALAIAYALGPALDEAELNLAERPVSAG